MVELLTVALWLGMQADGTWAARLEAALHAETVDGDLKSAVSQYSAIVAQAPKDRHLLARALFQMAQCEEKLGQHEAAHSAYQRLVREFADQTEMAARAHERLAAWTRVEQGPRNLDFERGVTEWTREGSVGVVHDGCWSKLGCAVVVGPGKLTQSFSAAEYRGKTVRLRAWLKVEAGRAQVLLSAGNNNAQQTAVDAARWTQCEIGDRIDARAQSIQLGVLTAGKGRVWIDGVSFEVVPEEEIHADRDAIQQLYTRLDAAYQQPDFDAISDVAAVDAQYRDAESRMPLRKAIEKWTPVLAHRTAVTAFKLWGNGAIVTVRAEYVRPEANPTRSVSYVDTRRDTWVRVGSAWRLKEHWVLTTRQVDSTTDAQTAKLAAADLKRTAAPLATMETGHTFYDLAPFGAAVGEARIVAMGEAASGTREFFRIKLRLLEYLVREKGFSVLAINTNWQEAIKLDLYLKSGEGDPKALLTEMLWPWNTQEMLEVVEWMREFNMAPGTHATLSFASFGIPPAGVVIPRVMGYLHQCSPLDAVTAETNYAPLLEMESRLVDSYDDEASRAADKAGEVVRLLDAKRELLTNPSAAGKSSVAGCSAGAWRDARQDAEMARQDAVARTPGKGATYGNEMMARSVEWLAKDAYPGGKMVLWGRNALVDFAPGDNARSVATWLREEFGEQVYVTGFALHRGDLLAIGVQNGNYEGVAKQTVPKFAEDNGDSVLSAAGMPVFFLDLRTVPATTALGQWLAGPHSFLEVEALWNRDDPQSNSRVRTLAKSYDGLIFLEEGHAARGL